MTDIAYCTREQVQQALGQMGATFRSNARIDTAIRAGARDVTGYTHRRWHPTTATIYPDFRRHIQGSILWLDSEDYEVLTVASFTVDGTELIEGTDFYLDPDRGPSYTSLRLIDQSDASFSALDRGNVLTGELGSSNTTRAAGALDGAITNTATTVTVTDSSLVGVGDLLVIGSERINVVHKLWSASGATVASSVAASAATRTVSVDDGTQIHEGEFIAIGAERMFVEQVAGNVLTVTRAEQGSVLAAHSSSDVVYVPRACIVERGATGSTAVSHSDGATVLANDPPSLVKEAALAFSLVNLEQGKSAYGRVIGSGDNTREASGRGLQNIVDDLVQAHGRIRLGVA